MTAQRPPLYFLFAIILLLGACSKQKDTPAEEETPAISVFVKVVEPTLFREYIDVFATLRAKDEVDIYPDVDGKVRRLATLEGQNIRKDGVILYIDRYQVGQRFALSPIRTPVSGQVVRLYVVDGEDVTIGKPLASVGLLDQMEARMYVPEAQVYQIKTGQKVFLSPATESKRTFEGVITRHDYSIDQESRSLLVRAIIDNSDRQLYSGMFMDARILVRETNNVFVIPASALFDRGSNRGVYVHEKERAYFRPVHVVADYRDDVAIDEGLESGDEVVVVGREFLTDGARILANTEESLKAQAAQRKAANAERQSNTKPKGSFLKNIFRKKDNDSSQTNQ